MYVEMLETVCIPPLTSLICEIKRLLILWKYQVILVTAYIFILKVINYAYDIRLRVSITCTFTIKHGATSPGTRVE